MQLIGHVVRLIELRSFVIVTKCLNHGSNIYVNIFGSSVILTS
jgi:hypothetical protein